MRLITLDNLERFKSNLENTYGRPEGLAQLDVDGQIPVNQIPRSAFNVDEFANTEAFPVEGEHKKLYLDLSTNNLYRWDATNSQYVSASSPDGVKYIPQTLTEGQKAQARQNIDAVSVDELPPGTNVQYVPQELTAEQKLQARQNIDAISVDELPPETNVQYVAQELTGEQKTQARTNIAAASQSSVSSLENTVSTLNDRLNNFGNFVREVSAVEGGIEVTYDNNQVDDIQTGLVFNGGYVDENNYLYLKNGDDVLSDDVFTPVQLPAGGGGGGGGSAISMSDVVKPKTVRNGKDAIFSFVCTTSDDTEVTVKWYVDDVFIISSIGDSGDTFTFNAKTYLKPSDASSVKVVIESAGGSTLTRKWTITSVAFAIEWGSSIDPVMFNSANTNIFVPINVSAEANTSNIVTVQVGNNTVTRTVSGSLTLNVQLDKTYFATGVNVVTASMVSAEDPDDRADDIQFTMIWAVGATSPVVAFAESGIECDQYELVDIVYFVYDPNDELAHFTLTIGSGEPRSMTSPRTLQRYQYTPLEVETTTIRITCGSATQTIPLKVNASQYNLNYYTDDSLLYVLNPVGHSNSDSDRELFGNLTFSQNFDWENGGFRIDPKGATAFVVKKGNSVTLPRCLFEDSDVNGKTIDISFKAANSDQYDTIAMQELNDGSTKGIILRANNGELRMNNVVGQEFKYCEDSRVDLSILVESNVNQRIATIWLDGIPSNVNKYTSANTLVQSENRLVIGSEHCDVWVYAIRVYNSQLTKQQMVQNYISNGNTTNEKVNRYRTNIILDNNNRISVAALRTAAPNLTIVQIAAPRMTVSKKDPVPADITITDGANVLELPAADGTVFQVQGTSSAAYGRSSYNLDINFKGTGKKYKISENAIGVNYINIKVNVASSENANNINAVDWYNTYQPYLTEPRTRPGVRDTVEGKPCAVFITNTNNESVWFSSLLVRPGETVLYAMGDICNSKKNKDVFGQDGRGEHPTKACIEVSGNDTEPQRFRSTEAVFNPAADDGKGDWETTTVEQGETKVIKHFEWRMNPASEDLQEVVDSWDNLVAWVVSTIGDSAKFKQEVGDYFAIDSLLYHFLFIEYFAAYDNISKNTFYSYDWDEGAQKYLWNIKAAYDMDTILASDNDGKPFGDYGLDYGDTVNGQPDGRQYFNAANNPIWVNIQSAFKNELSSMYISLRSAGAWNSQNILNKWDTYQDARPHAAMIIDAYNKYIEPYKTTDVILGNETKSYDDSYLPRLQGSKTYWRKQFLTYQTAYMDGKYGYYSKSDSIMFRTNCAEGTRAFSVKAYAKTYITLIIDDNKAGSRKIETGQAATFDSISVGTNTTLYFTPERLIQYIRPLNDTQNSTFTASGASKLTEAILGGSTVNASWPAGTGVSIPSVILKDFSIRNLPNFSDALNLSGNVELETLDTRGTNAGLITLPSFAPLTTVQLNACTGISAFNLKKVVSFTMESGLNLVSIQAENCNNVVFEAIKTYLIQAMNSSQSATRRIRVVGVNWSFDNLDTLSKIATTWKGYNNIGEEQNTPVVTGTIHITTLSKKKLEIINDIWGEGDVDDHLDETNRVWSYGNLSITYDSLIPYYTVTFLNGDDTHIKDKNGNDYYQYIDFQQEAYDPVVAGDINTPELIDPEGQYRYTFTGWNGLSGIVVTDKTVKATYTSEIITYTVRWYDKVGGTMFDERTNVPYGTEVIYDENGTIGFPVSDSQELAGIYKVFTGWDKSTGFVTSDLNVYATWDTAQIPATSKNLKNMSVAEIYAIAKTDRATEFFNDEDYVDIRVGKDFEFENVQSELLLNERYFNGDEIVRMNNIRLFDENAPSFTLAVDYEYCEETANATIVSCCDATGEAEGFRVFYNQASSGATSSGINVLWGDKQETVAHGLTRGILVLRHRKGSRNLYIASDNSGRYVQHSASYGGDEIPAGGWAIYRNDAYTPSTFFVEIPRTRETNTDSVLSFGGMAYGTQGHRFPAKGWVHWAKIWYADLGSNVIKQLASWPHETWRMHYRGHNLYNKDDGTGLKDSASFIANAPLPQYYEMYNTTQTTTEGGWKNSILRSFVNGKCYNALPYSWQSIIKPVSIITKGGSDNPRNFEYTTDKIYVPAFADLSTATGDISSEGSRISWFTDNSTRVKFMGITVPENAQIITELSEDPTLYTDTYTIREGDVWISPSMPNQAYVYISADTASKHGYYGGRDIDDLTNNIAASGTQGGLWIRSRSYWTRTNNSSSASQGQSQQYVVYPKGNVVSNASMMYPEYQRRGIVLMFSI